MGQTVLTIHEKHVSSIYGDLAPTSEVELPTYLSPLPQKRAHVETSFMDQQGEWQSPPVFKPFWETNPHCCIPPTTLPSHTTSVRAD